MNPSFHRAVPAFEAGASDELSVRLIPGIGFRIFRREADPGAVCKRSLGQGGGFPERSIIQVKGVSPAKGDPVRSAILPDPSRGSQKRMCIALSCSDCQGPASPNGILIGRVRFLVDHQIGPVEILSAKAEDVIYVGNETEKGAEANIRELGVRTLQVDHIYECNALLKKLRLTEGENPD